MKKDTKIVAKHKLNGEVKEFELVATSLKRIREGQEAKFYPWFPEDKATFSNLADIFSSEMLEEMAVDALNREFQMLYFQRSPSGEQVPVIKPDGTLAKLPDGTQVTKEDDSPRMDQFLMMVEDENLSGRTITSEYCMRKAINIQTGVDRKWKDKPELERMIEAMKWMQKAQTMMVAALNAPKS